MRVPVVMRVAGPYLGMTPMFMRVVQTFVSWDVYRNWCQTAAVWSQGPITRKLERRLTKKFLRDATRPPSPHYMSPRGRIHLIMALAAEPMPGKVDRQEAARIKHIRQAFSMASIDTLVPWNQYMVPWNLMPSSPMKSPSQKTCAPLLESHIGYWLRLVSNQISGAFARALQKKQLSVAEWVALNQIQHRADITAVDLADLMGMTRGAISKVLDKLESKKLVRRKTSREDSRVSLLSLTPSGQRSLPDLKCLADNNDRYFFAPLDPEERALLRSLMEKLARAHQMHAPPID